MLRAMRFCQTERWPRLWPITRLVNGSATGDCKARQTRATVKSPPLWPSAERGLFPFLGPDLVRAKLRPSPPRQGVVDDVDVCDSKVQRGMPCLFTIVQRANGDAKLAGKLHLRLAKVRPGLADKPSPLCTIHRFQSGVKVLLIGRISRKNCMLFLHHCCAFSLK